MNITKHQKVIPILALLLICLLISACGPEKVVKTIVVTEIVEGEVVEVVVEVGKEIADKEKRKRALCAEGLIASTIRGFEIETHGAIRTVFCCIVDVPPVR